MARHLRRRHAGREGLRIPPGGDHGEPGLDRAARRRLRAALVQAHPWVADEDWGPAAVEPGDCHRCERRPRVAATCGPVPWPALCRDCLLEVGAAAFCDGHADDADAALAFAGALPPGWETLTRLAWVATGEVRADPQFLRLAAEELRDPALRAALAG